MIIILHLMDFKEQGVWVDALVKVMMKFLRCVFNSVTKGASLSADV